MDRYARRIPIRREGVGIPGWIAFRSSVFA